MIYPIVLLLASITLASSRCEPNRQINDLWSGRIYFT